MVGRGNDVIDLLPPYSSKTSGATAVFLAGQTAQARDFTLSSYKDGLRSAVGAGSTAAAAAPTPRSQLSSSAWQPGWSYAPDRNWASRL